MTDSGLTTWTVPIGMGLLLLTPSVVLVGFLLFRRPRRFTAKREPRGFPVVHEKDQSAL